MFELQYTYFIILAPAAIIASVLIGVHVWSYKDSDGSKAFSFFMALVTGWNLCYTLELLTLTEKSTFFWTRFSYLFITTVPIALFIFSLQFFGKDSWLRPSLMPIFFVIPIITNLLLWTPNNYTLIWEVVEFQKISTKYLVMTVISYGDWFLVSTIYSYALISISTFLMMIYTFRSSILYRQQALWIFLGALFPIVFNVVYVFDLVPLLTQDFTPISFSISGIMVSMGIFRYQLFDLSPMARDVIIDRIDDGFIISDRFNRIIDMNPSAAEIFQVKANAMLGQPIENLLTDWHQIPNAKAVEQSNYTININRKGKSYYYELKVSKLQNKQAVNMGTIVILRDVTERVELLEEVQQLATLDGLTKIYNRRHFYQLAQRVFSQSIRYHRPVSILLMDIDHFKIINDSYGHLAGDEVLKCFANICNKSIRESDILARFGGEEFIIMMPETGATNAVKVAERLRDQLANTQVSWNQHKINVTVSIGTASLPPGAAPIYLDALIDQADQALYHAKQTGRNRVAHASEVPQ